MKTLSDIDSCASSVIRKLPSRETVGNGLNRAGFWILTQTGISSKAGMCALASVTAIHRQPDADTLFHGNTKLKASFRSERRFPPILRNATTEGADR